MSPYFWPVLYVNLLYPQECYAWIKHSFFGAGVACYSQNRLWAEHRVLQDFELKHAHGIKTYQELAVFWSNIRPWSVPDKFVFYGYRHIGLWHQRNYSNKMKTSLSLTQATFDSEVISQRARQPLWAWNTNKNDETWLDLRSISFLRIDNFVFFFLFLYKSIMEFVKTEKNAEHSNNLVLSWRYP